MELAAEALMKLEEWARRSVTLGERLVHHHENGKPAGILVLERDSTGAEKVRELIPEQPPAAALAVHTLQAVRDFLEENRDNLDRKGLVVHVVGPRNVAVRGPLRARRDREVFLQAVPPVDDVGGFNAYASQAEFVLWVQRHFLDTDERKELLRLAGTLADEDTRTAVDDGVSQIVATKAGSKLGAAVVKNPWRLVPRRSFPEIALDPVDFVLRVKGNGPGQPSSLALFEADGGAWKVDAIAKIRAALTKEGDEWGIIA
jgi:hypothetical protein